MRWVRLALIIVGSLVTAYGGWLLVPELTMNLRTTVSVAGWLLGGPVLHDALLAPAIGLLGVLIASRLPPIWRTPIAAGLVVSGVLVLIALPGITRPGGGPTNPGLHDRDHLSGLAVALALVWLLVGLTGLLRARRARDVGPRRRTAQPTAGTAHWKSGRGQRPD